MLLPLKRAVFTFSRELGVFVTLSIYLKYRQIFLKINLSIKNLVFKGSYFGFQITTSKIILQTGRISNLSLTMKVVQIGTGASYEDLILQAAKEKSAFGQLHYLKDNIYLVQNEPVTDYTIGQSKLTQKVQLTLNSPQLKAELDAIAARCTELNPELIFKPAGDTTYLKIGRDCAKITPRCTLQYNIRVYGAFHQKNTNTAFLQYELYEAYTEKISLLKPAINYVPNASSWNA